MSIQQILKLKQLKSLKLDAPSVTDIDLVKNMSSLQSFVVTNPPLKSSTMLGYLQNIVTLEIVLSDFEGLEVIGQLIKIKNLVIKGTEVMELNVDFIQYLKELESLTLENVQMNSSIILARMHKVHELVLINNNLKYENFELIRNLPLTKFVMVKNSVTDFSVI